MTLSTGQVTALCDNVATAAAAYNAALTVGNASAIAAITTGSANLLTRVASLSDATSEIALINQSSVAATNVLNYHTALLAMNSFYAQYFPFFNAFDALLGGLAAYLVTNSLQVNYWAAQAFNYWTGLALARGDRFGTAPSAIATANMFPYAAVDPMISFTTGTGTTMTSSTAGSTSSSQGGGVGPLYLYKTSAGNAAGGAVLTITYTNAAGASVTTTYTTTTGTAGSQANVAAGGAINLNVNAQAVTSVTGTGMTSGEIYSVGTRLVRSVAY